MHISVRGIIEKDDGIILIHRIKPREDGTLRDYYVVPGGKQEKGESNLETLNREIKEELGITVDVKEKLIEMGIDTKAIKVLYKPIDFEMLAKVLERVL